MMCSLHIKVVRPSFSSRPYHPNVSEVQQIAIKTCVHKAEKVRGRTTGVEHTTKSHNVNAVWGEMELTKLKNNGVVCNLSSIITILAF